jgi:formate dehydrogenase subunit gamma
MNTPHAVSTAELVEQLIGRFRQVPGGLLPLLHAVQDALGHIPPGAVPAIAAGMNLSRAEVHGVISYYHHFRSEPPGRTVVQVCKAESCKACGADALLAHAERTLHCQEHHTRGDGAYTLEPVYCLGLCAASPAVMVGEQLHARMTPARFDRVIAALEQPQ